MTQPNTLSSKFSAQIPNLQVSWDATSLKAFEKCPRLYKYKYIDNYTSIGDKIHLKFGLLYHDAIERYNKLRYLYHYSHEDALYIVTVYTMQCIKEDPWYEDTGEKNDWTVLRTIIWSLNFWHPDQFTPYSWKDENGAKQIGIEFSFSIPLEIENPIEEYLIVGHIDAVMQREDYEGEGLWLFERKTTKQTLGLYWKEGYEPDIQVDLYAWAGKQLFLEPIEGIILDGVQSTVFFSRFARFPIYKTEEQVNETGQNIRSSIREAEIYALENFWPMRTSECFRCPFRKVCKQPEYMRQAILDAEFEERVWDPTLVR